MRIIEEKISIRDRSLGLLLVGAALVAPTDVQCIEKFSTVRPEAVGFSSERLRRLEDAMQRMVDGKQVAGIVTIAARHGKIFHSKRYGLRDIESQAPIKDNTIFRIYSMTKPVTGVAMMMLYEEGKWSPHDPISKHVPEFANLKVFKGLDSARKMQLEDPVHPPTMRELMTHTAGFSYGMSDEPVDKLYQDEKGQNAVLGGTSPQEMIDRLARIPLAYQPGTRWLYSASVDIQGYIVEKLSGQSLSTFMKERIFEPLGMTDTGFHVPQEKGNRFATLYERDAKGAIVPFEAATGSTGRSFDREPGFASGGGGLVSTAGDYLKFAQMLASGGALGGVRILGPETVRMMTANHLNESLMSGQSGPERTVMRPGHGFGYDVAVYTDPSLADNVSGRGSYYWGGAAGTWFWIDPTNDLVFVGMVQNFLDAPNAWDLMNLSQQTLYQALVDPRK